MTRGRPKGRKSHSNASSCFYCEGLKFRWGKECSACDGTGSEKVRKQLQKVYNAKNNIPLNFNLETGYYDKEIR